MQVASRFCVVDVRHVVSSLRSLAGMHSLYHSNPLLIGLCGDIAVKSPGARLCENFVNALRAIR
jgi:hypothetical protein